MFVVDSLKKITEKNSEKYKTIKGITERVAKGKVKAEDFELIEYALDMNVIYGTQQIKKKQDDISYFCAQQ